MFADKRIIVVVDDNEDCAETSRFVLECEGHVVHTAYNAPCGLSLTHRVAPKVVFADVKLGGWSGFDLGRAIRTETKLQNTVLVATTGLIDNESIERRPMLASTTICRKPFEPELLLECAKAPRQNLLIVLSEMLVRHSLALREHGMQLSRQSNVIREQSQRFYEDFKRRRRLT